MQLTYGFKPIVNSPKIPKTNNVEPRNKKTTTNYYLTIDKTYHAKNQL